jgi:phosphatidylserine decarboxylase
MASGPLPAPFVLLQHVLPQHALSRVVYGLTRSRSRWLKNTLIRAFMRGYHPAMDEALVTDPLAYASFNDFFTRALHEDARPLPEDPAAVVSPADGVFSAIGQIEGETLLQAKDRRFTVTQLLAGRPEWARTLAGGRYATIYLAPFNYHRIHMPAAGRLTEAWHVPGRLFSVNAATCAGVDALFARNERVVCTFEGRTPFVVVLVGALFVGSMTTVWHGDVTPPSARAPTALRPVTSSPLALPRAAELGRFNMGSTVIVLWPRDAVRWAAGLTPGSAIRMGQIIGTAS